MVSLRQFWILDFGLSTKMNKSTLKTLKFWSATTSFVVLTVGFAINKTPEAIAQAQTQTQSSEVQNC